MNITGEMKIFKDEKLTTRTFISNKKKDENGEEKTEFWKLTVGFPKDKTVKNKSKINVTKGFLSFYSFKDGEKTVKMPKVIVQEFEVIEEGIDELEKPYEEMKKQKATKKEENTFDFNLTDDLPF